jgi:small subunit ribosomal protein S4
MNKKLNPFVKTCKQSQSFLWGKDRLSQTQKKKIVLYKKKKIRQRYSEFANQLRAKQLIATIYGKLSKKTMQSLALQASTSRNQRNEFLCLLEMRLDTCLFRMNLGPSFVSIRQYINHGFILVNGRKLNISSSILKPGDIITIERPFPLHWKTSWFSMMEQKHLLKRPVQHLEINYKLCNAIVLFPPQQIYYPCRFQVQSALRFLSR